jgi:predicted lipoprotein with Yx(FWY)xxD motif
MRRKFTLFIAAAALSAAALGGAALGGHCSASSQQASKGARVALGKTRLGKVLVDARGRTLYLFAKDKRRMSACYGACATYWPPLVSSAKPRAARGVRASLLA